MKHYKKAIDQKGKNWNNKRRQYTYSVEKAAPTAEKRKYENIILRYQEL